MGGAKFVDWLWGHREVFWRIFSDRNVVCSLRGSIVEIEQEVHRFWRKMKIVAVLPEQVRV